MPIREMLYYICMNDGFGGDAVQPRLARKGQRMVPAGPARVRLQFEFGRG
jgi:hypothetical protein